MKKIDLRSPYFCMLIVLLFYVIKVILKIYIGLQINSVSVYSDGVHNISDFFEAILIIFALYIAKAPANSRYPLGKSSIESIGSFLIGLALLFLGINFFFKSLLGLITYFGFWSGLSGILSHFVSTPEKINFAGLGVLPIAIVFFSVVLSWFISWYQVSTGKKEDIQV